ncbi:MAG: tRNA dihydrouridine synthase DusB [Candidatus Thermoplasmatota archaeon]
MRDSVFHKRLQTTHLMLPPLTGYTDYPYRVILSDFHPPFLMTEMINAQALVKNNKRTLHMIQKTPGTHLHGVQLLGRDPKIMADAAHVLQDQGFDYIDINMGCTVKKVTSRGEGVALMAHEQQAYAVVRTVTNTVDLPVTVKLRLGITKNNITIHSLAQKLEDAGAAAITIHARSGEKKFATTPDYTSINNVVEKVSIPVIANGGIFTGADAEYVLKYTRACAVMPGRGLIGNPWIIPEILNAIEQKPYRPPTFQDKKKICLWHLQELCDYYGERRGVLHMRKILPKYFSSIANLKNLKQDVLRAETEPDIAFLLEYIRCDGSSIVYINK